MLTRIFNQILNHLSHHGKREQIFIIPTFDALKLLTLNGTLLIIGLVYANNFVLFFNFILFCLFLGSMYYTHFNLRGLKIESVKINALHVGETSTLSFRLSSSSSLGHYFLNLRSLSSNLIEVDSVSTFSLPEKKSSANVNLSISGKKRGFSKIDHLSIETFFPFHLFRAIVIFPVDASVYVYPEKTIHSSCLKVSISNNSTENDDSFTLRAYNNGDSLKHIHWKKLAQSGEWYTKINLSQLKEPVLFTIDEDKDIEEQLSSISTELYQNLKEQTPFGINLKNHSIPPALSQQHLLQCQRLLARYET